MIMTRFSVRAGSDVSVRQRRSSFIDRTSGRAWRSFYPLAGLGSGTARGLFQPVFQTLNLTPERLDADCSGAVCKPAQNGQPARPAPRCRRRPRLFWPCDLRARPPARLFENRLAAPIVNTQHSHRGRRHQRAFARPKFSNRRRASAIQFTVAITSSPPM